MAGTDIKNNTLDEKTAEKGMHTSFRRSSESNSLKDTQRTALALNGSPRRCVVFKVFTLEFDACRKLLLPVALPMHETGRGIHFGPGVHGNVDNLEQASPTPSILFKPDPQKEQITHLPDCRGFAKAFVVSSSSRGNVTRQSRKNKRCRSVKNFSITCLQNSVLSNISSCLVCDGSNLVIHNTPANCNLTVSKPTKRNLKKTKKKGKQYKSLLQWRSSVESGSVCDESVCESSIIDNSSSPEEISVEMFPGKLASNSLLAKVFSVENNDSDDDSSDAVKASAVTVKCIPSIDGMDVSEQVAALSVDFAQEDLGCNQTDMDECSTNTTNYSSADQTSERGISTSGGSTCISNLSDVSLYSSSGRNNAFKLDTVLDSGNGDNTACMGADVESRLCIDHDSLSSYADCVMTCNSRQDIAPQCITSSSCKTNCKKPNDCQTCDPCSSEDPVLAYNTDERARCSSEACSSSTSIASSSVKRGRNSRKLSGSFNVPHKSNTNTYARTRKDVNHSVWQRVQKNSGEESMYELKDPDSLCLQNGIVCQVTESRLEDNASFWMGQHGNGELLSDDSVSLRMKKNAVGTTKHLPKFGGKSVSKIPDNLKIKSMLVPKQGPKKGPQNGKNDLAQLVKNNRTYAVCSSSVPDTDSQRLDVSPTQKASSFSPRPWVREKNCANEMGPTVHYGATVHNTGSYAAENGVNLLAKTLDSLDMKCTLEVNCDVTDARLDEDMHHSFCHPADMKSTGRKAESGGLHTEHTKQDNNSLPVLQKWVPVGKRDEGRSKSKSVSSESVRCFSPDLDGMTGKFQCSSDYLSEGHVSSNFHFTQAAGNQGTSNLETDLGKINLVVKEAYKLQIASETFHLANGSPLAEFERFLYSASPVLGQMYSIHSCKFCSLDQWVGNTLCQHQVPNISLRNLWQWYEKPGNYGLEVKVEDYLNPKTLGNDKINFRAYFVPYLSAVQLFGWSAKCTCFNSCISDGKINKKHETDNTSENSSQLSSLPIFSLLVPRPRKEAVIQVLDSSSSSYPKDDLCNYSVCKKCFMAQELVFEYFESDQPQLRRPFLEKIKELVKGSSFSNSQTSGDPLKLESLNLHDLHPASWFSVAWYPIYRIPDGNFRAAFLTYHSLGHFTHRSALSKSADGVSHIVSPVVGLQSYNAKGECWFRQRDSQTTAVQPGGSSTLTPPEILKERLSTLESTASVMSRASVPKGGQTSVNRQPDYEFFLSRRS